MALDPVARRYALDQFNGLQEEANATRTRDLKAARAKAAAEGNIHSGGFVRHLARLYGTSLGSLLESRVQTTIDAYLKSRADFDDAALAEETAALQQLYEKYFEHATKALVDEVKRYLPELASGVVASELNTYLEQSRNRAARTLRTFRSERLLERRAMPVVTGSVHDVLKEPKFTSARSVFTDAEQARSDNPPRDRDVCANAFDAMESVGKVVFSLPHGTFGEVLKAAEGRINSHIIKQLRALEILRHNEFGHGTAHPFSLTQAEVEYVFWSCAAAILLLTSLRQS